MKNTHKVLPLALIAAGCGMLLGAGVASAETVQANLKGFNEVPAVSTTGNARFRARIDEHAGSIFWELDYDDLQADATQAHIHFGERHTNGGITVWLCGNPPLTPPAGTQLCPARSGTLSGTIMAANVVGPGGAQQLPVGGFEQLVRAIRGGATYANVHTTVSPGGEIRGQIRGHNDDHDHDHH
ncbi:MAG TPA: CHRD domain-containing protein [Burkholderiaceae bacterium]|nr:CHRD domain-containing protein [Burkholderiaceae bacterium]